MTFKDFFQKALIPAVFILGLAAGVSGFWFAIRPRLLPRQPQTSVSNPTITDDSYFAVPWASSPATTTERNASPYDAKFLYPPSSASGTLDVEWYQRPQQLTEERAQVFFRDLTIEGTYAYQLIVEKLATSTEIWVVGRVTSSGAYQNQPVYLWKHAQPTEIGGDFPIYNYIIPSRVDNKTQLLLLSVTPSSDVEVVEDSIYFVPAPHLRIRERASSGLQEVVTLKTGKRLIRGASSGPFLYGEGPRYVAEFFDSNEKLSIQELGQTVDGRSVYSNQGGCLIMFGDDGLVYTYASVIEDSRKIAWASGFYTTSTYDPYKVGGCGFHGCADLVDDKIVGSSLIKAGTTADGDAVYVLKDPASHEEFKKAFDEAWYPSEQKPTLQEYAKKYPNAIFFWKDAFGRWVRYVKSDLQSQAECGKPVIYLYPEKTTAVSVRLPSFIHVSVSDPPYSPSGWQVIAHPDGTLVERAGNVYTSLYWEGTGVGYAPPRDGFVVKDGEVDAFLAETLPRYGLNDRESREFRDFWAPQMTGAPYYRISFLTNAWSAAAPLFVSPRPDTAIRIFMDWRPLAVPISLPEPHIETPVRRGFTLVEWGGTLWK